MKKITVYTLLLAMLLSASACSIKAGGDARSKYSSSTAAEYDQSITENIAEPCIPTKDMTTENGSEDSKNGSSVESLVSSYEPETQTDSSEQSSRSGNNYVTVSQESGFTEGSLYENSYPLSSSEYSYPENSYEPQESRYSSSEPLIEPSYEEESSMPLEESSYVQTSAPAEEESSCEQSAEPPEESSLPETPLTEDRAGITEIKPMLDSFTVSWESDAGADGYIVQYSKEKKFKGEYTKTVSTKDTTLTVSDLDQGGEYYVRYCSYRALAHNKTYSDWSGTKLVKLREMTTVNGVTYIDGVLIVNKTYSLPADYGNGLTEKTMSAFNEMVSAAAEDGITLWIVSGFRSYETQNYTYHYFVNDRGVEQADRASARPGHSEHQTGLAIDVNTTSDYFANTPEAEWLKENCFKYGFIIRYPEGKEDITGYKYEPWHIRYVGVGKAEKITKSGLTLEEYYGITSKYQE